MSARVFAMPMDAAGRLLKPEEAPEGAFECASCRATLWLLGQSSVVHDCATGEVSPA